jgi:hypothetical protein
VPGPDGSDGVRATVGGGGLAPLGAEAEPAALVSAGAEGESVGVRAMVGPEAVGPGDVSAGVRAMAGPEAGPVAAGPEAAGRGDESAGVRAAVGPGALAVPAAADDVGDASAGVRATVGPEAAVEGSGGASALGVAVVPALGVASVSGGLRESFIGPGAAKPSSSDEIGPVPAPSTIRAPRERSSPPRARNRCSFCSFDGSGSFSAWAIDSSCELADCWSPNIHWAAKSVMSGGAQSGRVKPTAPAVGAGASGAAGGATSRATAGGAGADAGGGGGAGGAGWRASRVDASRSFGRCDSITAWARWRPP